MHKQGFGIDRVTQAWVRATGQKVGHDEHPWLAGPTGSPAVIGDEWLEREADRLGAR